MKNPPSFKVELNLLDLLPIDIFDYELKLQLPPINKSVQVQKLYKSGKLYGKFERS